MVSFREVMYNNCGRQSVDKWLIRNLLVVCSLPKIYFNHPQKTRVMITWFGSGEYEAGNVHGPH